MTKNLLLFATIPAWLLAVTSSPVSAERFEVLMMAGWEVAGVAKTGQSDSEYLVIVQSAGQVKVCSAGTVTYQSGQTLKIGECIDLASD